MLIRSVATPLAVLAALNCGLFAFAAGCEPQDIYMFDEPVAQTRSDAGPSEPEPAPSSEGSEPNETSESDDGGSEPGDSADPDDAGRVTSEQPECRSDACNACVADGMCAGSSALSWCHPARGTCAQACDPAAAASQVGSCPAPQRCSPALGLCLACITSDDCGGASPVCDDGRCVQCSSDSDCSNREDERLCLVAEGRCAECRDNTDCTDPERPVCSDEYECED